MANKRRKISMAAVYLPEDVMLDILSRLPVRSLMRFRSVCKSWFNLFQNQEFLTKHHRYQTLKSNKNFIVKHGGGGARLSLLSFTSTNGHLGFHTTSLGSLTGFTGNPLMLGPVNGLLCFYEEYNPDFVFVCNPATSDFRRIRCPPINHLPGSTITSFSNIGFGFDRKTNDYKILRFLCDECQPGEFPKEQVQLYSLRNDIWRDDIPYIDVLTYHFREMKSLSNPYVNGVQYWFACYDGGDVVLSFDFADEVFDTLPLLKLDFDDIQGQLCQLTSIKGRLSIIGCSDESEIYMPDDVTRVFLWIITKCGSEPSWEDIPYTLHFRGDMRPVGVWEHRWFFHDKTGKLVLYEPCTEGARVYSNFQLYGEEEALQIANYVETMVPVNARLYDNPEPFARN